MASKVNIRIQKACLERKMLSAQNHLFVNYNENTNSLTLVDSTWGNKYG